MKFVKFLFGLVSYIIFLGTFLYAIAFVGDFAVPKTINTGAETTFASALVINLIVLSVFALQHSIMARPGFKKWWTRLVPEEIERSVYVLFTCVALILIFWLWRPMTGIVWEVQNQAGVITLHSLFALGWLIVLLSTFMISHFELFGLKQVYENLKSIDPRPVPFTSRLLYGVVRHPIMLGFIIAFWATPVMTVGHLVFSVTTALYILVAIKFLEERDLRQVHGKQYMDYQKQVPMLVPFTKIKSGE